MNSRPQLIPMAGKTSKREELEKAIDAALEQQQALSIPVDFAARVAERAALLPRRSHAPRARYARSVAILLSAILVVALFLLAPHAQPTFSSLGFDIELAVTILLAALAYWLTRVPSESL